MKQRLGFLLLAGAISLAVALRGYAVWTLRVRWDAERPGSIPPETGGTSIIYQNIFHKTVVFCKESFDR